MDKILTPQDADIQRMLQSAKIAPQQMVAPILKFTREDGTDVLIHLEHVVVEEAKNQGKDMYNIYLVNGTVYHLKLTEDKKIIEVAPMEVLGNAPKVE